MVSSGMQICWLLSLDGWWCLVVKNNWNKFNHCFVIYFNVTWVQILEHPIHMSENEERIQKISYKSPFKTVTLNNSHLLHADHILPFGIRPTPIQNLHHAAWGGVH